MSTTSQPRKVYNMPKRFRDTEAYKDKFVRNLPPDYKHLWFYMLDDCDHAGIWRIDFEGASLYTGCKLTQIEAEGYFKDKVTMLDDEYWFIKKFVVFQYGETLNPDNKVHASVLKALARKGIDLSPIQGAAKPHASPLLGSKDKEMDKVKDKPINIGFDVFWQICPKKVDKLEATGIWKAMTDQERTKATEMMAKWAVHPDWVKERGQYVPSPARWLRKKKWNDELTGAIPDQSHLQPHLRIRYANT